MRIRRRKVVTAFVSGGALIAAGCTENETADSSDTSNGSPMSTDERESNCRMETRTESTEVADSTESVSAGADWVFHGDREEGDVIIIEARQIGGDARPALEVEDPHGNIVAQNDPSERIYREVDVSHEGRYYVRFPNEAYVNSGMWDVTIEVETEYEEEVCE